MHRVRAVERQRHPVASTRGLLTLVLYGFSSVLGCASVIVPPDAGGGGFGGTGGTGGTDAGDCILNNLEDDDDFDDATFVASGTVNGTCQIIGAQIDCGDPGDSPDLVDQWPLDVVTTGLHRIELSWSNDTSDLDLGVMDEATCEVIAGATSRTGRFEVIEIEFEGGTTPLVAVVAIDTNGFPESYELRAEIVE